VLAALNNRIRHLWPVIIIITVITSLLGGTDDAARVFYDFIFKPQRRARGLGLFTPPRRPALAINRLDGFGYSLVIAALYMYIYSPEFFLKVFAARALKTFDTPRPPSPL